MALDAFCCTEPCDWSKIPICLQSIGIFGNVLTGVGQLSRNLEEALEELERDVPNSQHFANVATKITSTSSLAFLELSCTRSSQQLLLWKQAFHARYKKSPEEVVACHTTGDFRELLLSLMSSYRYGGDEVDLTLAKEEAKMLREKILEKAYSDKHLIWILASRSKAHHSSEFGNDINKDLKTDPKDKFLFMLRATVRCLTRPEKYFEKVLCLAIKRQGTDEAALIRVVVTRAEVDMKLITEEYQRKNNVPLHRAIVKDTHGEYEKMLLAMVGHADP
ncbi:annexin D1 [Eucalyptus grandis]|uniref:annexin D1 n=1 Tax=Eucalyptus grandis TaxID=71139 RepID=UPI00192F0728|nr:annexin D1 [Eucalyptus grandis]